MLKYFGLKEIMYGLKRFAIVILAVTFVCGVFGYVFNKIKLDAEPSVVDAVYSTSHSYIFTAEKDASSQAQGTGDRACAANAAALLQADFTKEYVYEKLLEEYSKEDILKYTGAHVALNNMNYGHCAC